MNAPNFKDLTGQVFGKLRIACRDGRDRRGYATWQARCGCGKLHIVASNELRSGDTTSCGCERTRRTVERSTKHGCAKRGGGVTPEYRAWQGIKTRCGNPKATDYELYGGRGIKMFPEWIESFESFLAYIGKKPSPRHSIDRFPNRSGNYEPGNVRWATPSEQCNNTSRNRILCLNGESATVAEWADKLGIPHGRIRRRLDLGWAVERALS